ncbi:MAG: SxtJ family membrane protein [Bacteroidota bacterium]
MIDTSPKKIRNFGLLFGVICLGLAAYFLYRDNGIWSYFAAGAGMFLFTGFFLPVVLKPVYVAWMTFAFALGWMNTRLLLGLFFFLVMTPVGLIVRLTGRDLLDEKIDRSAASYWRKRERKPFEPSRYERLF